MSKKIATAIAVLCVAGFYGAVMGVNVRQASEMHSAAGARHNDELPKGIGAYAAGDRLVEARLREIGE